MAQRVWQVVSRTLATFEPPKNDIFFLPPRRLASLTCMREERRLPSPLNLATLGLARSHPVCTQYGRTE